MRSLAVIAAGLLLPETGNLVLLDEFCDVAVIWIVCIAVALWFSKDIGLDLAAGPQTATLTDIQLSKAQAHTGIFSHHYYLTGSDNNGVTLRAEITGEEYSRLPQGGTVTIEYYDTRERQRTMKEMPVFMNQANTAGQSSVNIKRTIP